MEAQYEIINKIHSNFNSDVFKVKKNISNKIFALKVIKIKEKSENIQTKLDYHLNECNLLKDVKNDFIIEIKDYWISNNHLQNKSQSQSQTKENKKSKILYLNILMDYYEMNLEIFILKLNKYYFEKNMKFVNDSVLLDISLKLIKGLEFLHNNDIIHRDIKPSNILIKKVNNEWDIKFIDFGISKKIENSKNKYEDLYRFDNYKTYLYSSPEQLKSNIYNFSTDLFSIGLVLLELFHRMKTKSQKIVLFNNIKNNEIDINKIIKNNDSKKIWKIIKNLLNLNFKSRISLIVLYKKLKEEKSMELNLPIRSYADIIMKKNKINRSTFFSQKSILLGEIKVY